MTRVDRVGRRRLEKNDSRSIKDRLIAHVGYPGRYKSRMQFERDLGLPHATVTGWFAEVPRAPDTYHLIQLGRRKRLNLNWLLLGEGPELIGPGAPVSDLKSELQTWIRAEVTARYEVRADEIEYVVPGSELMLAATCA